MEGINGPHPEVAAKRPSKDGYDSGPSPFEARRKRGSHLKVRATYFLITRTGLPASHCLMLSTISV